MTPLWVREDVFPCPFCDRSRFAELFDAQRRCVVVRCPHTRAALKALAEGAGMRYVLNQRNTTLALDTQTGEAVRLSDVWRREETP